MCTTRTVDIMGSSSLAAEWCDGPRAPAASHGSWNPFLPAAALGMTSDGSLFRSSSAFARMASQLSPSSSALAWGINAAVCTGELAVSGLTMSLCPIHGRCGAQLKTAHLAGPARVTVRTVSGSRQVRMGRWNCQHCVGVSCQTAEHRPPRPQRGPVLEGPRPFSHSCCTPWILTTGILPRAHPWASHSASRHSPLACGPQPSRYPSGGRPLLLVNPATQFPEQALWKGNYMAVQLVSLFLYLGVRLCSRLQVLHACFLHRLARGDVRIVDGLAQDEGIISVYLPPVDSTVGAVGGLVSKL